MKVIYNAIMSRTTKQIVYGVIYLSIFLGIFASIYFTYLKPPVTCFDSIQNQNEEGVDCGGSCAKVCTPATIAPITAVGNVMTFATSPHHVTFLVRITNTNFDFAAKSFDYRFDLSDASGAIIQSVSGTSFIYAGEAKYLIVPNQEISSSVENVVVAISNPVWAKSSDLGAAPQFVFHSIKTEPISSSTIRVSGTITDNDVSAFDKITVIALFKNSNGMLVGTSQTELDQVIPNEAYDFSVLYPTAQSINLAATEVTAYAMRAL